MNRIEMTFNHLKQENKKALITYMMAGYPSLDLTYQLMLAQEKAGVDLLEIGIPFSDPLADGPVIQDAGHYALQHNKVKVNDVFQMIRKARKNCETPIVLMLYYNTILKYGLFEFVNQCKTCGIDGLIIPDLPFEEQDDLKKLLEDDTLLLIQLVAPTSSHRLKMLLKDAKGFVYCISSLGVTGRKGEFHQNIKTFLTEVRAETTLPVLLGFGITTPEDVHPFHGLIDGVIIGTRFIQVIEKNIENEERIIEWCQDFKQRLND